MQIISALVAVIAATQVSAHLGNVHTQDGNIPIREYRNTRQRDRAPLDNNPDQYCEAYALAGDRVELPCWTNSGSRSEEIDDSDEMRSGTCRRTANDRKWVGNEIETLRNTDQRECGRACRDNRRCSHYTMEGSNRCILERDGTMGRNGHGSFINSSGRR
eukprot:Awhi_evm1s13857